MNLTRAPSKGELRSTMLSIPPVRHQNWRETPRDTVILYWHRKWIMHETPLEKTIKDFYFLCRSYYLDKRKNIDFVFFQHDGKYVGFYQTNKILYPQRPNLVNLSLYQKISKQGIIKGFYGLNLSSFLLINCVLFMPRIYIHHFLNVRLQIKINDAK